MAIKAKMSFDKARMKQFFVTHGEKVALAIGLLLSAYVVYGATQVENYNRTPQELSTSVTQGRTALANFHKNFMDLPKDNIRLPTKNESFLGVIERELLNKLSATFFNGLEWNRPLFETKLRRKEPEYLAVTELVPVFHHGAVGMKGPGGDQNAVVRGEEWISLTGLVPFDEQTAKYAGAFKNAIDPLTNATPAYRLYEVKRAEMSTLDPNEAVDWEKIQPLALDAAVVAWLGKWADGAVEPAPPNTVSWPPLTEPLPPLPNKDFAGWSIHPTLAAEAAAVVPAAVPVAAPAAAPAAAPQGGAAPNPFGIPAAPAAAAPVAQDPGAAQPVAAAQRAKFLLFRFLDFDIEPGKRYRYQVKLILKNPNYSLDQAHLEKPEMAVGELREAPWSAPSPTVEVPHIETLLAGAYKSVGGDLEPEISVGVKWWFPNLAAEGFVKFDEVLRGAILNGPVKVAFFTPGKNEATQTDLVLKSDVLVVDFGWEKIENNQLSSSGRRIQRPAEVLLLNPRGELKIALQTMDSPLWAVQKVAAGGGGTVGGPGGTPATGTATPTTPPPTDVKSILNLR